MGDLSIILDQFRLFLVTFLVVCSCHDGIIGFGVGTLGN